MTNDQTPEDVRNLVSALGDEPVDEDAHADQAETGEEYIDADDLLTLLARMQETLDEQSKELRGLRREMREIRDQLGQNRGAARPRDEGGFRPREDRGDRGGFRGRDERAPFQREGGFRPREDRGDFRGRDEGFGNRGATEGGFRREDRGFRPREDRGGFRGRDERGGEQRDGGFRPREDRPREDRPRDDRGGARPRDERGGNFGNREFRPREDRAGGDFRPRARRDHGWGKKRDE